MPAGHDAYWVFIRVVKMPSYSQKLLVLDLDETLVHADDGPPPRVPDFWVGPYWVIKRPGLESFIKACLELFQVGVWTASSEDYAAEVVPYIFPDMDQLAFLWARLRCTPRNDPDSRDEYWLKDLNKLRRRGHQLKNIIVVDDDARNLSRQHGNLVCVRAYRGEPGDDELRLLPNYLATLARAPDVRLLDKRQWRSRCPSAPNP
jgi:RNA polymerase II subunit A small phosphatase-like protein